MQKRFLFLVSALMFMAFVLPMGSSVYAIYNGTGIYAGNGNVNLSYINQTINNASLINDSIGSGIWSLGINLYLNDSTSSFYINNSDTKELRLFNKTVFLRADTFLNNINITAYQSNSPDITLSDGRGNIINENINHDFIANNVTFNNLGFADATNGYAIELRGTGGSFSIQNSLFHNNTKIRADVSNLIINNNTFKEMFNDLFLLDRTGNNITNNLFTNTSGINVLSLFRNMNNTLIEGNTFHSVGEGIRVQSSSNNTIIRNNVFYNMTKTPTERYAITINTNSIGTSIINNTFSFMDIGTFLLNSNNFYSSNNTYSNITASADAYLLPLRIESSNNFTSIGDRYLDILTTGVWVFNSTNINFSNSHFELMSYSERANYLSSHDYGDTRCAVSVMPNYKGIAKSLLNPVPASSNISMTGNTFGQYTQCYLRANNVTGITQDFTDYWYRSFQTPINSTGKSQFWMNNSFNNMSNNYNRQNFTWLFNGYGSLVKYISYNISKDYLQFTNGQTYSWQMSSNENTNVLIYNNSFAVINSSDISLNDGDIFITLRGSETIFVLDNFNLTEGVTRQFSPLSISGTSTSKTITSQLSQAINATVVVNVAQCSFNAEYKGSAVEEQSCSNNVATFSLTDIPASTSSLTLQYLDINCSSNTNASVVIILAFSALAIVGLTFILIIKFREGEFDVKILIIVFIAIIVGLVLFTETAQLTGSVCSG